jgi:hypothetical protein
MEFIAWRQLGAMAFNATVYWIGICRPWAACCMPCGIDEHVLKPFEREAIRSKSWPDLNPSALALYQRHAEPAIMPRARLTGPSPACVVLPGLAMSSARCLFHARCQPRSKARAPCSGAGDGRALSADINDLPLPVLRRPRLPPAIVDGPRGCPAGNRQWGGLNNVAGPVGDRCPLARTRGRIDQHQLRYEAAACRLGRALSTAKATHQHMLCLGDRARARPLRRNTGGARCGLAPGRRLD